MRDLFQKIGASFFSGGATDLRKMCHQMKLIPSLLLPVLVTVCHDGDFILLQVVVLICSGSSQSPLFCHIRGRVEAQKESDNYIIVVRKKLL